MGCADGTNNVLRAALFALLCSPTLLPDNPAEPDPPPPRDDANCPKPLGQPGPQADAEEAKQARLAKLKPPAATPSRVKSLIGECGFALLADVASAQHAVGFLHVPTQAIP